MSATVSNIRRLPSDELVAFFSLEMQSGVVINHCILAFRKSRRDFTVYPPHIPLVDEHGRLQLNAAGEAKCLAVLSFSKKRAHDHFVHTSLMLLRVSHPDLFRRPQRTASDKELLARLEQGGVGAAAGASLLDVVRGR